MYHHTRPEKFYNSLLKGESQLVEVGQGLEKDYDGGDNFEEDIVIAHCSGPVSLPNSGPWGPGFPITCRHAMAG